MSSSSLIALLRFPQSIVNVPDADWNEIVERGRETQLLGQLAARLRREQLLHRVPVAVQRHLALAALTARRRSESALWEITTLRRAVDPAIPMVLLKGCAYLTCADDNAAGRLFSDIDIMVRRETLPAVEASLVSVGWKPSRVNAYDLAYYRNWMHEVPSMEHVRRHTVVDLHHAINPPVSRYYVNPDKLFERVLEVRPGVFVLATTDRVIHCALHLLQEGEPKKLLRDLYDLHLLVLQYGGSAPFMEQLRRRAIELKVASLLENAMGAAHALFGNEPKLGKPAGWLQRCVEHSVCSTTQIGKLAGTVLLAHAHWMKMPLHLLVPHLARKSYMRMASTSIPNTQVTTPAA